MSNRLGDIIYKIIPKEKLALLDFIIGIFGVAYGFVAFFYYFLKISPKYSLIFLFVMIIGLMLFLAGRRGVSHGTFKEHTDYN